MSSSSSFLAPVHALATDLPRLLRWAGFALLGLAVLQVINSLLPLALATPEWQLQQVQVLLQQGPMALIGLCLLGVARQHGSSSRRRRLGPDPRRGLAMAVALGYALLIPLQIFATASQWQRQANRESATREQIRTRLDTLYRQAGTAGSDQRLQQLLRQLPVAAPSPERLGADLPARRQAAQGLIARLSDTMAVALQRREERRGLAVLRATLRNSVAALLLATVWLMVAAPRLALARRSWLRARPFWSRRHRHRLHEFYDPSLVAVSSDERDQRQAGQ